MKLFVYLQTFARTEKGQDLLEYALLTALIALAAVTALGQASTSVNSVFSSIATKITGAA